MSVRASFWGCRDPFGDKVALRLDKELLGAISTPSESEGLLMLGEDDGSTSDNTSHLGIVEGSRCAHMELGNSGEERYNEWLTPSSGHC